MRMGVSSAGRTKRVLIPQSNRWIPHLETPLQSEDWLVRACQPCVNTCTVFRHRTPNILFVERAVSATRGITIVVQLSSRQCAAPLTSYLMAVGRTKERVFAAVPHYFHCNLKFS
jgi:hypothetical protein